MLEEPTAVYNGAVDVADEPEVLLRIAGATALPFGTGPCSDYSWQQV
jgi:hypothetical protein